MHQVMINILDTKDLAEKVFNYIDPWDENLASILWEIRASNQLTIQATPGQDLFGRYMIFNLLSFIDWQVITAAKQQQVDIDNV